MTMKELAKIASVSVSTVSKAFCDADDVSKETKEHIFALAREHGVFGKYYKGKYHKKIIAIICPEFRSNYYTRFLECLQGMIEASDGICVVSADRFDPRRQAELIEYYASYLKVDGLIVFGMRDIPKKGYTAPIVSLLGNTDVAFDSVNVDMDHAIKGAVRTLHDLGHTKLAFLGETLTKAKANAFCTVAPDCPVFESTLRFEEAGEDGVRQLLKSAPDTTAIICAYDNIALGAIRELRKNALSVPEDVSVIGIDNIPLCGHTETTLTSIDCDPEEVCRITWDLLQKKISSPHFRARQSISLKPSLIVRESVAPPRTSVVE